jgi:hypothetical protein
MKNNIEPIIQSMKKINNSIKRAERDDEFFFEDGFFKTAELFLGDFIFLEIFVDDLGVIFMIFLDIVLAFESIVFPIPMSGALVSSSSSSRFVVVHVLFILDVDFEVSVVVVYYK